MTIHMSEGIKCKACDAMFPVDHHDPELCNTCLMVVRELNGELDNEYQPSPAVIESIATVLSSYQLETE